MSVLERLEKREKILLARIARVKRLVAKGRLTDGEDNRLWLESFTKGKKGLDICCGDLLIGEAEGVDGAYDILGVDYLTEGDDLNFAASGQYNYVVTNYFDAFAQPLKTLNEWNRVLTPGGIIAFICCNAKLYTELAGPLANRKRQSCYTEETIKFYLERTGYRNINITGHRQMLRCYGEKI